MRQFNARFIDIQVTKNLHMHCVSTDIFLVDHMISNLNDGFKSCKFIKKKRLNVEWGMDANVFL